VEDIPDDVTEYPTLYSPNALAVKREVYDICGGFDEVMRMTYEESDFGSRVAKAGFEAYISAKARTDHYGYLDAETTPVLRRLAIGRPVKAFTFARNRLIFARRHFSFLQSFVVAVLFAPLSAVYYGWVALKNKRIDIAAAYCAGTILGVLGIYPRSRFDCRAGSALRQ
jgi:GT2 family glycosyltransferase